MVQAQAGPSFSLPRTLRLYEKVPGPPLWTGVGVAAALIASYAVSCLFFGRLLDALEGTAPDHIYRDIRTAMVTILGVAFVPTARIYLARATHQHLSEIWPRLSPEGQRAARDRASGSGSAILARVLPPLVALLMILFLFATIARDPGLLSSRAYWIVEHVWHWLLLGPLGWMMGSLAWQMIDDSRLFQRLAHEIPDVDLLDPSVFAPFVRQGLVGALIWILFLSISSSLLIDLDLSGPFGVMAPAVLGVAITALVIPVWGARGKIREVKRDALAGLRCEIRESEAALHARPADEANSSRLRALLAWEARIERVREWPFDASTLFRFLLYVALGVGSWLGAALVERGVDSLLG
jgi:hypothetical protein